MAIRQNKGDLYGMRKSIAAVSPVNELKIFENPKEIALLSKPTFFCFKYIQF